MGYVPSRCAWATISSLSMPISGRNTCIVATAPIVVHVFQRLRGHLADRPRRSPAPARAQCARDLLGDAQHQPAVDHHAQRRRHREHHLLLNFAERHEIAAASAADTASAARELADFFLRRSRQNRIAVEMDEALRGTRAASSDTRRPANRCRPTADRRRGRSTPVGMPPAGLLAEMIERFIGHHLDVNRELRLVQIDASSRALP